jgi:hypothetical protein
MDDIDLHYEVFMLIYVNIYIYTYRDTCVLVCIYIYRDMHIVHPIDMHIVLPGMAKDPG